MKNIFIGLVLTFSTIVFAETKEDVNQNAVFKEMEEMTAGMTPEMKKKFLDSIESMKRALKDMNALSPAEREKKLEAGEKASNNPDLIKKRKEIFDKMSEEDKKMLKIYMENLARKYALIVSNPQSKEAIQFRAERNKKDERSIEEMISNPSSRYDLYSAAITIANSETPIDGAEVYLNRIVKATKFNTGALEGVVFALIKTKSTIKDPNGIFYQMVHSSNIDSKVLDFITRKYYDPSRKAIVDDKTFRSVVDSKVVSIETLEYLLAVLSRVDIDKKIDLKKMIDAKILKMKS
jgi:hypothetical protein